MSKQTQKYLIAALLGLTLGSAASLSFAQPPGGRGGPPPEATEACANLSEGDACSFEGRRGETLEGECFMPPRGEEVLACKPEGGSRERPERFK